MIATPADIHIRTFDNTDTDAVIALWREAFPEYNSPDKPHREPRRSIANKMAMRDGLFFVAVRDNKIAGTVMAGYDGHRGWVYSLAVARVLRRRGVASALLRHAEIALAERGCLKLNLQVLTQSRDALAFYTAHGYAADDVVSLGKRLPLASVANVSVLQ
ncbi:GNAT family acetyltransferase [Pandoraea apista]|uniref:Acetyltransferase n=1 Tax=Pandoraea apista TaxID=93218 RepID=A0A0G4JAW3_9BURK|nr:GNAT family acetyltransferase [Pandoraea apista]ALS67229.1 GNAT family acetyltransferase [Pandoraea apista]OXS88948.1 GNAT family acetyltransferase [Pandoraea apista]RRW96953.1 GNAT family acetyltransferase [Pandoraea apista]RRX01091.1 GNAT family acetyltransferase [Pandoraea apista]CFB60627.1 Acetyltransferase YpeA [Pandoraea apista]